MVNPLAGALLTARYRLIEPIGSGNSGVVWDARDETLDIPVAIRELRFPNGATEEQRTALLQEARLEPRYTGRLTHPNIVAVHDVVEEHDRLWIVLQRVTGRSLAADVAADGPWEPARAARLGIQLVEALIAAHQAGIVHGAIKPSNVLVPEFSGALLTDFPAVAPSADGTLAAIGTAGGTAGYSAPERLTTGTGGPAADLYSLGATLYFAVEGTAPGGSGTTRHRGPLAPVIDGLLSRDPGHRPSLANTREQLSNVLGMISAETPRTKSQRVKVARPAPPRRSRRRLVWVIVAAVVALGLAGAAFAQVRAPHSAASAPTPAAGTPSAAPSPSAPDTTAPQQPVSLVVSGRTTNVITLVWTPAIDDVAVTGYRVQRNGVQVGATPTADYADTGLAVKTAYTYTVIAVDAAGNASVPSAAVAGTTLAVPDTAKPTPPTRVRVTGRSTTSIVLNWTAATDDIGVARYQVRRDGSQVGNVTGTRFTDNGLAPGTTHTYSVRAVDAAGNVSDPSAQVTSATLTAPDTAAPSVPGALRATDRTTTTIKLAWNGSVDNVGVTGYWVYRNGARLLAVDTGAYTDTGLAPGTTYAYQVRASDGAGNLSAPASLSVATIEPQVTGVTTAVSIGGVPNCTATVSATVSVSAGPVTVSLQTVINGETSTSSVSFGAGGAQSRTVTVGTGVGTADGTAQVSSTAPNTVGSSKSWNGPSACQAGFTVGSASASAGDCGSPTISGSVRVTALNNGSAQQFTVQMRVDGSSVAEKTVTIDPNSSDVVGLTSPDPFGNGSYSVTFVVTGGGDSHGTGDVPVSIEC
ncbi:chitodextrinase [Allocatelliglobosispora scoriae]|uniref:non-specific serine/threonine protein kinase n=1 Tax=Allocatelliglobosispora scoriae TaxID=643052 RepID=A0A841C0D3_9ACTN|nr:fibronectin type III domain-containing protein [Allocatelliglobosispora scoriae]MBB5873316.1 chitodextrinase [Allocatelliglobosispora scoriae]